VEPKKVLFTYFFLDCLFFFLGLKGPVTSRFSYCCSHCSQSGGDVVSDVMLLDGFKLSNKKTEKKNCDWTIYKK